jgi:hypothetical protein
VTSLRQKQDQQARVSSGRPDLVVSLRFSFINQLSNEPAVDKTLRRAGSMSGPVSAGARAQRFACYSVRRLLFDHSLAGPEKT